MDIDLVYLWVDGNDPAWLAKKLACTGAFKEGTETDCKARYESNDELKYSLRSAEKYVPWIRKIFIITDNQIPVWLDTSNPKIQIIDHRDIMPEVSLPCFNSSVIEYFLYKIPDLSEHFLFANDDMFINKSVSPDFFFNADGFPVVRLKRKSFRRLQWFWRQNIRKKELLAYRQTIINASELVKKKYGIYYNGLPHHNIDAYLKSDLQQVVEQIFKNEFQTRLANHIRNLDDIQRIVYLYVALAEKRGHLRFVSNRQSMFVKIHKESSYRKLARYCPVLFCMNDSQFPIDDDRKKLKVWLQQRFPDKSSFEK